MFMGDDFRERRRSVRYPTRSLVEVKLPTWDILRAVYSTNISLGGIRLSMGGRPPIGAAIDVILTLPTGQRLHLPGRIANLAPDGSGDVGVRFDGLQPTTQQEIEQYVADIRAGHVPAMRPLDIPPGQLINKDARKPE
jgi:hypothetical protein